MAGTRVLKSFFTVVCGLSNTTHAHSDQPNFCPVACFSFPRAQDTQICAGARVFYVQYKWVEEFWPDTLGAPDNHIASHPVHFYLDGQDTDVTLTAKLRLYRKAVHLVICECRLVCLCMHVCVRACLSVCVLCVRCALQHAEACAWWQETYMHVLVCIQPWATC